jgi:hypothetical protein
MTALALSTDSTIGPLPQPDASRAPWPGAEAAPRPSLATIVASLHGRTGKTLLARVLADYFALAGNGLLLFDTNTTEQTLRGWFPYDTIVADLTDTRDQMILFDTLASHSPASRVVDVSHYAFRRFFKVMEDCRFGAEARTRNIEPIIFYIADRNADAYEEGQVLRDRFADCAFVLVQNAFVGPVKEQTRRSAAYRAFETHDLAMTIPSLDGTIADQIDDPQISLGDIINRPLSRAANEHAAGLTYEEQSEVRRWLLRLFRDIHRVARAAEDRRAVLSPE